VSGADGSRGADERRSTGVRAGVAHGQLVWVVGNVACAAADDELADLATHHG